MSKKSVLSPQYVRVMKTAYAIGLVVMIIGAITFFVLPFVTELPTGSHPHRYLGTVAIIGILCASRLSSLEENAAIYKAITESAEKKD